MIVLSKIRSQRDCLFELDWAVSKVTMLVLLLSLLAGCSVVPNPLTKLEMDNSADVDHSLMFSDGERLSGDLSLEEAIARALKYNLDKRTKMFEHALALKQTKLDEYSLLPNLIVKGSYSDRSEFSASNSKDRGDGPPPSSGFSYSSDRTIYKGDLTLSWSVLDFGVSYYNARQNADRALIIDERRRKVVHNLIREVQFAYWRMVAAQKLSDRVGIAIKRAELALIDSETVEKENLKKPSQTLRFQKRLLQNIRKLETVNQQLSSAQIEVAALINIPPGTYFRVVVPNTDALSIPQWVIPLEKMEMLAFHKNPDIREKMYQDRISLDDAKKSLLSLLPGIDLSGGRNSDSNSFQDVNRWFAWSNTLSVNVLKALSIPDQLKHNEAKQTLIESQRLSLRMALLAQVHIANKQYFNAVSQYKRANKMYQIDKRLSSQIVKRQESDLQSMLDRISQETAAIDSELRRYETYSNVISAIAQIHSTLGIKITGTGHSTMDLKVLSQSIQKGIDDWISGYAIATELRQLKRFKTHKRARIASTETHSQFHKIIEKTRRFLNIKILKNKKFEKKANVGSFYDSTEGDFSELDNTRVSLTAVPKYDSKLDVAKSKFINRVATNRGVRVLLNETSSGGSLTKAKILCMSLKRINSNGKWIEVFANTIDKQGVRGWLHKVYFDKLSMQCAERHFASKF